MWQAPNQRVRAIAQAKRRERERARRPLHIKRVSAELKVLTLPSAAPMVTDARVLLNDFSPKGLGLFCGRPLGVGQEVAITLESPRRIYVRGRIVWCQEYDCESHVLSQRSYSYRIGVQFTFETVEEQKAIKAFCDELSKDYLLTSRVA